MVAAPPTSFSTDAFDQVVMTTYGRFPIALLRGEGCRVWDDQGRSYLDFVAGIATCTLGHAHPALVETVSRQMQTLHHVSNLYYIPQQGALAQWLVDHSCGDRVFFCNSGAEANEAAIKLARKYAHTVRHIANPIIITAQASFHGRTLATITATGQPKYQQHFDPLVPGFAYVPYNDFAALQTLVEQLDQSQPQVAAILLEPLQGEGGVRPGDRPYFEQVRQLCTEKGILLIFDEVQAGMGRTGSLWGYETLGVEPDIFTLAKGLAGGVPIGAMIAKEFCAVFQPGDHASTFGGNPLATAAALTVCETLEKENLLENVRDRGQQLRTGLRELAATYPQLIAEVRGWGLINGLELQPDTPLTAAEVVKAALAEGLLLVPAGPQVVRFVPPLIVSAAEIDMALGAVSRAFAHLAA
ncbi:MULTISPECIES: aspartate aminotransferase family protein [unclassified Thermosynechococcus]|uniref:aspartate aminotransferase family protein n=1 Tax=unclassified Thermosynechococcus TaxID=2622553 RepID=UPI00198039AD|nr:MULTISPECIES: aspartate aminotransferase family protein [unclassified Thermosynechococcus]MDR5638558.1 aspartate aminotransferase family protein [Thermosynechococcus sp. PP42]MDR7921378.1 aspartate aminotransferase family protein [Thermosynechococcus sp. HY213]QSF49778.1 aspartate aminotransferase family protein [Thermosynechococcus sp. TA-1]WKT81815.1 aspartate aminotransferase family protein [Thermosynechococcus sp. PP45]WNC22871.1 aspartate aminotransferase family protein [Thermosynechoc